ncbi:hypothetical protein [Nocardiopsis sp. HUAS JQ3]|uniref:hypothetical protein n=1 Tax=Nocardiopsis sp. HUAS JQ3 TaxID=3061629 RepID=UPI0023A9D437|nr:hypothetical protein [Nocardiopsis sp. HUAS JQ3]WDZ91191.1 hypothetical protein PV789_01020 [Nocardiopsis sp. HUAS JQ3]
MNEDFNELGARFLLERIEAGDKLAADVANEEETPGVFLIESLTRGDTEAIRYIEDLTPVNGYWADGSEETDPDRAGVLHLAEMRAAGVPEARVVELSNAGNGHTRLNGSAARAAREAYRRQLREADAHEVTETDASGAAVPRVRDDVHTLTDPRGYTARCWSTTCLRMLVYGPDGTVHERMERRENGTWDNDDGGAPVVGRAAAFHRAVTRAEEWRQEMDTNNETEAD